MIEKWKDIKGYEGLYQVSNLGRVKSLRKGLILKQSHTSTGYMKVELYKNKKRKGFKVHRLVAFAFIKLKEGKEIINHKDGNPLNNKSNNLEWCTQKENVQHAIKTGLTSVIHFEKTDLKNLYLKKNMGMKKIAKIKKVSCNVIKRELNRNKIKLKTRSEADTKYFITKEFLEKELKTKSQRKIAKEIGCDQSLLSKYKKKFNI